MNTARLWKIKIGEHIYHSTSDEIIHKIRNEHILRQDQVKSANGSWVEIGEIPEFDEIFKEELWKLFISTSPNKEEGVKEVYTHFQVGAGKKELLGNDLSSLRACFIHPELPPYYKCTCCENIFCKNCPQINESRQALCPICGGFCELYSTRLWTMPKSVEEVEYNFLPEQEEQPPKKDEITYVKLTFADFVSASIYPFRFPFSLTVGGISFSILFFGIFITTFRGDWTFWISLVLLSLIVMLKFGVLTKTCETFFRTDSRQSFLPRLSKYTFWEDFINPFFVGLGTYIVSFGVFFAFLVFTLCYAWFSFSSNLKAIENEMTRAGNELNTTIQRSETAKQIKIVDKYELRGMIDKMRLEQLESTFGRNHLIDNQELGKSISSMMRLTIYFHIPLLLTFMLGVLYFPAVCLTVNNAHVVGSVKFTTGLKSMRKLGFDYLKIIIMGFILVTVSMALVKVVDSIFTKYELPLARILLSIIVSGFLVFYFWTAFSSILAIVATKNTGDGVLNCSKDDTFNLSSISSK